MNGVQEFFSIVPWTSIFQYCNLLILCLLIKKFLFKPVMAVLKARQDEIDGIYDAADKARGDAAQMKEAYTRRAGRQSGGTSPQITGYSCAAASG